MARDPLYKKAELEMLRRMASGDWPVGMRLGNEFQLAEEFGVSQGTMRRALMSLESAGRLNRKPGRGTIVAAPDAKPATGRIDLGQLCLPDGAPLPLTVFRARQSTRPPEGTERELFQGRVHVLTRTLKSGGDRFALEEIVVDADRVPDMDEDQPVAFTDILSSLALPVATLEDRVQAEVTSMSDSVALSCDRHTALLCLTRIARTAAGEALAMQSLRMVGPSAYRVAPV